MNYTSIEQSKHLLELGLDPGSADMHYNFYRDEWDKVKSNGNIPSLMMNSLDDIPCWSVGALLDVMPKLSKVEYDLVHRQEEYYAAFDDLNMQIHEDFLGKTPLEAVYNMVVWLLKNDYIKKGE